MCKSENKEGYCPTFIFLTCTLAAVRRTLRLWGSWVFGFGSSLGSAGPRRVYDYCGPARSVESEFVKLGPANLTAGKRQIKSITGDHAMMIHWDLFGRQFG